MKLGYALKKSSKLFLGIDSSFIGSRFEPNNAFVVEVGLVETLGDRDGDDDVFGFETDVFGSDSNGTSNVLAGGVADELVDARYIFSAEAGNCSVVADADVDNASFAVAESC